MMRNIPQERKSDGKPLLRRFHQARWDEPIIYELSRRGQRGILVPEIEAELGLEAGNVLGAIPEKMRRKEPPRLPEISQPQVLRHYLRLSQENLGADFNIDVGQGTCTMKYSPKINEHLIRSPKLMEQHPLQDESTLQGTLEIIYRFEQLLKEISGMSRFTLQPSAGSTAIYTNVSIIRAYHESRGDADQRDEIITTIFSHPSNAACAKTAGFKVITLYPDGDGYPDIEALKAAVSDRTAALLITNPEDTGIFNPRIQEFVEIVHSVGGLCAYDQANANGILGITRAGDTGFDLCHFNLHKTFSTPHGCGGPAAGASGVSAELARFLPVPTVEFDGDHYFLDHDRPDSIGKIGPFYGVVPNIIRAYAWVMSLGAEGLREVAEIAVLNNNYLMQKVLEIPGVEAPYAEGKRRIEQVRYSWNKLTEETGVHSEEIGLRAADFGVHYWTSHHPFIVPEPCTLEPTESYSKAELDEYAAILAHVASEARSDPKIVKDAPHKSTIHTIDHSPLDDPEQWAVTWRSYLKKTAQPEE
ncbi:MAG TPA: aminomethyl-transferring glycine dehydrogenase subunit GcvPB [candidate division Zixibacteria bacterium]|nr:aminomethyl-transferring glycine dehydrogenase subunit GcvPB [candidate division Zixibacteria bacterium]